MTRKMAEPVSPWADWPLNREVVMSRVVDADRETAFNAWIDPGQIVEWFGHSGFRITTHQIEIR